MEYEKQSNNLQRNITIAIIAVTICCLGFYFYMFNNGLSNESNSWSNFGDYVNGVLTPIFTVINIYVFIKLTTAISRLEEKRYENSMEIEDKRREKEIEHEKELLLMQFRKQEIETFVEQTNRIFDYSSFDNRVNSIGGVLNYLDSFCETELKWFGLEECEDIKKKIKDMWWDLGQIWDDFRAGKKSNMEIYTNVRNLKVEITNALMEATLENTEDTTK